jgi:iron complex outermembrane recepter protein
MLAVNAARPSFPVDACAAAIQLSPKSKGKFMSARRQLVALFLASSASIALPAFAQTAAPSDGAGINDEIIVTAQKREESLQDVPISIQALGTRKLDQLNITNFNQFSQQLTSVAFKSTQPGQTNVYMRGVSSGGDGNHSGPLPSVGFYLDEQPITTIGGTLDVHIYDIARIESLSGPQGTLYGASSQAGTIRIITNKPSTAGFEGRVDGEINTVEKGGVGGRLEGMLNLPLSTSAALRVVGFYQRDAGFIDNVAGTRTFLGGLTVNNSGFVKKDFNEVDTFGGRAALKIDLDDSWTATPTVLYQETRSKGFFGSDARVGDLQVQRFFPEYYNDRFIQAALTIEGKLGNWDLTYAGAYADRRINASADYTDYAEQYDSLYSGSGGIAGYFYFADAAGNGIDPRQNVLSNPRYKKLSQELRVASPQDARFRIVAGLFYQRQTNDIEEIYNVANLGPLVSVNTLPGVLWLTKQKRVDKDYAAFGEASFDITPQLTLTAGGRGFIYDNSLIGFFGFGRNPGNGFSDSPPNAAGSNRTGVAQCFTTSGERLYDRDSDTYSSSLTLLPPAVAGGPCTNLAAFAAGRGLVPVKASGQGFTHRLNLNWKPNDDLLFYGTWSRGFRPGGINRRAGIPPYAPDFLTNYEFGFKTSWLDNRLRINGAIYRQEWKTFQYAFLGPNSFTQVQNGPDARIDGAEIDVNIVPVTGLTLSAAGSYTDAKTRQNLCAYADPTFACTAPGGSGEINYVSSPANTRLPLTPRLKLSGTARYEFDLAAAKAHLQVTAAHSSSASSDVRRIIQNVAVDEFDPAVVADPANYFDTETTTGRLAAFTTVNFAAGIDWSRFSLELFVQNAFDERAQLSRFQACGQCVQRPYAFYVTPRTIGLRAGAKF